VDLSKPGVRWATFGIVLVAIAFLGVGVYASRQPNSYSCQQLSDFISGRCTGTRGYYTNPAFLRPDRRLVLRRGRGGLGCRHARSLGGVRWQAGPRRGLA
jgi:hypothetical protein